MPTTTQNQDKIKINHSYAIIKSPTDAAKGVLTDGYGYPVAITITVIEAPFDSYEQAEERKEELNGKLEITKIPGRYD